MPKSKHPEAAIIAALGHLVAWRPAKDVAREAGVSEATIHHLRLESHIPRDGRQSGTRSQTAARRKQSAEATGGLSELDKDALQSVIRKDGWNSPL